MIIEQFVRWQLLSWILSFRLVCRPLKNTYPDLFSLEAAGPIQNQPEVPYNRKIQSCFYF